MKKAILYCDPRSLNDATNYYCGIIKRCIEGRGYHYSIVHHLSEVKEAEIVVSITEQYFLKVKLRYPTKKHIYWAQGVNAEETKMKLDSFEQVLRYCFRRVAESYAVRNADILFCVSDRMVQYYKEKYGMKDRGQIIVMPCYNLKISSEFEDTQYQCPIFAYAGNISVWQGIDFMLDVYSIVEREISTSKIRIFTKHKDVFEVKLKERNIRNYEISYVPVFQLQSELHKCKYGFIIRTNHIVNLVATPTKMNSYLAAYMIPIYSDGVDDFNKNIQLGEFRLMANCPLNVESVAKQIVDFEKTNHNYSKYKAIVEQIFEKHYNDEKYYCIINNILEKVL